MKPAIRALFFLIAAFQASLASADGIAGRVDSFTLESLVLGESRPVQVALPEDYDVSDAHYPVLFVLDAKWHFLAAVGATRYLAETSYISAHRIPRLIVVGIESIDRNHEFTPTSVVQQHGMSFPTSGGADAFLQFLRDELIPEIDLRYRTEPWRILAGWSLGGLFTFHAMLEHPGLFGAHLAISPSLWWDSGALVDRAIHLAESGGSRSARLVMTIGTAEEGGLCFNAVHRLDDAWSVNSLAGLDYDLVEIDGEDHNHGPWTAYFSGLRRLFADWFYPEQPFAEGLDALVAHYDSLSADFGYRVRIPDHLYDAMARQYVAEGRNNDAIAVQEHRCSGEPRSALAQYSLGETCRQVDAIDRARGAYLRALALERAKVEPDTVFTDWVQSRLAGLEPSP